MAAQGGEWKPAPAAGSQLDLSVIRANKDGRPDSVAGYAVTDLSGKGIGLYSFAESVEMTAQSSFERFPFFSLSTWHFPKPSENAVRRPAPQ